MSQTIKEKERKSCASCVPCEEDSPMATWIVSNRKIILSVLIAIASIAYIYIWISSNKKTAEYLTIQTANTLAQEVQAGPSTDTEEEQEGALRKLQEICTAYPSLQNRYDGLIAQELILANRGSEIDPYAQRSVGQLQRIGLTNLAAYSEVSRLAGMNQPKEALEKANQLKETMSNQTTSQYLLRAFLLLHIATLEKATGEQNNFEQTLNELKGFLGITQPSNALNSQEKEYASLFLAHLQEKDASLLDYLSKTINTNS
ncbi:MAG: hypothetical protein JSR46_01780 [Verrucomicrobia bacterium]|nr:hypothetical protein [Verrucomicrobiota bacterium]